MKLIKIVALLLTFMTLACVFASCATEVPETTVTISIVDQNNNSIIKVDSMEVKIKKESPTIIDAIKALREASAQTSAPLNIVLSEDETELITVEGFTQNRVADENGKFVYWSFSVGGKELSGNSSASDFVLEDGNAIKCQFVEGKQ